MIFTLVLIGRCDYSKLKSALKEKQRNNIYQDVSTSPNHAFIYCFLFIHIGFTSKIEKNNNDSNNKEHVWLCAVGHFRDAASLCLNTRPSANKNLSCESDFLLIIMQIKRIFTRKVLHLASF